jgi:hypothetical protein
MPSLAGMEKLKTEIERLESALMDSTDSQLQNVIQTRIKELKRELAQLQSSRDEP